MSGAGWPARAAGVPPETAAGGDAGDAERAGVVPDRDRAGPAVPDAAGRPEAVVRAPTEDGKNRYTPSTARASTTAPKAPIRCRPESSIARAVTCGARPAGARKASP